MSNLDQRIGEFFRAAQTNDVSKLKEILSTQPSLANTENNDGLTPLGFAAHFGNKEAVQLLLEFGSEINAVSHSNVEYIPSNTALHAAIAGERNMDVITLLLKNGASTNLVDSNGHTCLHTAAFHADNIELVKVLIEHGAETHTKDGSGKTALDLALEKDNMQAANFLRQKGEKE